MYELQAVSVMLASNILHNPYVTVISTPSGAPVGVGSRYLNSCVASEALRRTIRRDYSPNLRACATVEELRGPLRLPLAAIRRDRRGQLDPEFV